MKLSVRTQGRVLKILIDLSRKGIDNTICKPVDFESNFKFIAAEDLIECLKILEDSGFIKTVYADYPEHFNIYTLKITPAGLNYHPQRCYASQQKWADRIISFIVGLVSGCVLTYLIPWLISSFSQKP